MLPKPSGDLLRRTGRFAIQETLSEFARLASHCDGGHSVGQTPAEHTTTADTAVVPTTARSVSTSRSPGDDVDLLHQPVPGGDRFEIVQRLGHGGFGSVYEAMDRKHASRIALKLLGPS